MNQTGTPKATLPKSAPRAASKAPLVPAGEQLSLALNIENAAVLPGEAYEKPMRPESLGPLARRKRVEGADGLSESAPAIEADDVAGAGSAGESFSSVPGPFAQAAGSAGAPASDAAATSTGSTAGGGASTAAGVAAATDMAVILPAALAFGVGALILTDSASSSSAVATANQAPTSTPIAAVTASEGIAASVNVNVFTDPEGGALTYSLKVAKKVGNTLVDVDATWLSFDANTRRVVGTPPEGQEGEYEVTVTATDGGKLSKSEKFSFTVLNSDSPAVIDGYLKGALVYRDVNGDGIWNHDPITSVVVTETAGVYSLVINGGTFQSSEPWGITDQFGKAPPIGGGSGDVRTEPWTFGGKINGTTTDLVTLDISTLREWSGAYVAPSRSGVVNPITTLIAAAKAELGGDAVAAAARVKTVLGLAGNSVDLLNFDPLAEAAKAGTFAAAQEALAIQGKALQVANLLRTVAEVADAAGIANLATVTQAVARSLVANNAAFNLASEAALTSVVSDLKAFVGADAAKGIDAAASTVAKSLAVLNTRTQAAVDAAVNGAGSDLSKLDIGGALSETIQYQIVAQELVAGSLAKAVALAVSSGGNATLISAALNDISGLATGDAAALSRALIVTRASVGSVFVSSDDTKAANAVDDNLYVLATRVGQTSGATGGSFGNALRNDLVPRGFTTDLVSGRVGDEVTTPESYTALSSTTNELTLTGSYGTLRLERLSTADNGRFTYTVTTWPGADVVVEDVFSYRLQAVGSGTLSDDARFDFGTIRVSVSTVNFPPVVDLVQGELTERGTADPAALGTVSFNLLDAGRDPEGGALTLNSVSYRTQSGSVLSLNLATAGQSVDGEFGRLTRVGSTNEVVYTLDQDKAEYLGSGQTAVDVFNFELLDAAGKSTQSSIVVTIRGSDDPPLTVNVPPTSSDAGAVISEDATYRFDVSDFTFRDRNAGQTLSKVKIDALPTAGTLTFSGQPVVAGAEIAVSDLGATSGKLVFTPSANLNGNGVASFKFKVVDSGATPLASVLANTFAFDITAVNDAPVNTVPSAQTVNEDTNLSISGLSIADVDAGTGNVTVTLGVAQGTITVAAASGVTIGTNATSSVTLTGTASNINAALSAANGVVYRGALNYSGSDTLTVTTNDGGNAGSGGALADTDTVSITVTAVNDAPVNTVPSAQTVNEDTNLSISGLSIADVDAGTGNVTVTLGVAQGTITVAAASGVTIGTNATSSVTLTGTASNINAALSAANGVVYRGALNYSGSDTLTVTTNDGGNAGSGGALADTDTVSITVTAVNDAPVNTVPSAQTVNEDTNLSISGLSIADVDAGTGNVTVTLGVAQGTITVAAASGVTIGTNATSSVTLTGTASNINAALSAANGVVYRGALNYSGSDTLTVTTNDGGNAGSGGALADTDTVSITVTAVNDAPVNTVPSAQTVNEDTNLSISGLSIADVDAGTGNVTVTLGVAQGTITVAAASGVTIGTNATSSVTLTGTASNINAALSAANGVVYRGALNYSGSDTLTVTTNDGGNAGSGGALADTDTVSITVTAVNDAPVNTVPSAQTVNEDTNLSISGLSIADVDAGTGNVTVTLGVAQGTITVAAASGVTIGTNATSSVTLTGTASNINAALSAANGVVYRGALNYSGSDTLTVTTNDGGNAGSGGALADTDTVSITVTAVNDPPVFAAIPPGVLSKPEFVSSASAPAHEALLKLSGYASDVDDAAAELSYSIVGGLDAADFTIDALTGEIKFLRVGSNVISHEDPLDSDGNSVYQITVRVWDGDTETLLELEITVTNEDELGAVVLTRNGEPLGSNVAPKQGDTLVAVLDEPDAEVDSSEVVQWFADGIVIQGANSSSLTLAESLIGRRISAKISYDDFGSFDSNASDSVTSSATLAVLPRNTSPQLVSGASLPAINYTLGSASVSVPISSRFFDADGDSLSYRLSDSSGAALPAGLAVGIASNGAASIEGSPTAGFIGTRTLLVTATDPSGASATDSVTLTVSAPAAQTGLYLTQLSAQMTDFAPTVQATEGAAFKSATGTQIASSRVIAEFSSATDGVGIGADLSRENLLQLLDGVAGTGTVPYVSLPVVSTLVNGTQFGRMALKLALDGLPEVSVDLAVRVETSTETVNNASTQRTVFKVNGDQAPNSLASFKDGVELASATGSSLDLYLLRLLDQGLTASAKSLLSQVISDDLNATFSVSFTGLPIYSPIGGALQGIDTSVSIDDTPNRAPALAVPHQGSSRLGVQLPAGSTVALGELLADLNASGGLFSDSISDPNAGDALYFMVGKPTSGNLVWKGDVVSFPAADSSVGGDFKVIGSTVRLKVAAGEIDKLEYRANPSVAVAPGTSPADELASLPVSVVDASGAMSLTAPVGLKIVGGTVPNVLGLVGGELTLVDAGLGTAGKVVTAGSATVMSVPSNGDLFKVTQSGSVLTSQGVAIKVGDSILSTDLIAFEPADVVGSSTAVRDDLVLRQSSDDGVGFSRVDFSLAVAASDAIPTAITLTSLQSSVPEGSVSPKVAVAQVGVSGASTVNFSLSGADKDSFTLETVFGVTTLHFNAGITPNFEVRPKYDVRVNADNPNVGLAGSVEAVKDFSLAVANKLDTLELKTNTITLTDYDASGAAWSPRAVAGVLTTNNGANTLSFDGVSAGASFSRANLLKLFDTTVGNGKAPSLAFELDLSAPNAIPSGTAQINVTLEARSKALGTALPMTVTFPVTVEVVSSSSGVSISLPTQTTSMSLAVGGMSVGSLTLGNLDPDLFSLSASGSTSTPSALSIKLDNLFAKAEADKVPLASLGQGGAVGVAGAVAAAALGDKSLAQLVALARDVTTLPLEVADTPLGRIIDILQDTITVPGSLASMKFSEALRLGAKLVLPDNLGAATLGEAVGLGFKILDLPQSLSTAGDLLEVMRDAIDLPASLEGTLGSLRLTLASNSTESLLLDKVETLARALMAPGSASYTGSLADKTIPQLIDLAVSSGLGSVKLSEISSAVDQTFGGYSVPQMLSLASDIAENLYGSMSLSTMLQKANSVITLPASSSDLGAKSLSELLDIAQTLVVLGDLLQGGAGELAALTGGTTAVAGLVNLVQDAVTVDGQISGRSLANLLELMDTTFKVGDALGTGNSLSELINDLRNDVVDLDTMVHLASRAAFSDDGELRVSVDLPSSLVLLSAEDKVVNSLDFKALLSASQPIL